MKPIRRFDNCCPKCGERIGWEVLAKAFAGIRFDPKQLINPTVRLVCGDCDAIVLVEMLIDFATESTGKRKKRND